MGVQRSFQPCTNLYTVPRNRVQIRTRFSTLLKRILCTLHHFQVVSQLPSSASLTASISSEWSWVLIFGLTAETWPCFFVVADNLSLFPGLGGICNSTVQSSLFDDRSVILISPVRVNVLIASLMFR